MSSAAPPGLPVVDAMTPPVLVLQGPVTRDGVAGPCDALRALLDGGSGACGVVVCDVAGLAPPGLAAVNLLARLELLAPRTGGRIRLRGPDPALRVLLDLVGLRFEVEGQPEQREEPRGAGEAVKSREPPAADHQDLHRPRRVPAGARVGLVPGDPARAVDLERHEPRVGAGGAHGRHEGGDVPGAG